MIDKPMTATEVQVRMDEAFKRFPTPDFSSAIYDLARRAKRAMLLEALQGSSKDRMSYCINRAITRPMTDLMCYGTVKYDPDVLKQLADGWFLRLERLSKSWR